MRKFWLDEVCFKHVDRCPYRPLEGVRRCPHSAEKEIERDKLHGTATIYLVRWQCISAYVMEQYRSLVRLLEGGSFRIAAPKWETLSKKFQFAQNGGNRGTKRDYMLRIALIGLAAPLECLSRRTVQVNVDREGDKGLVKLRTVVDNGHLV